MMLRRFALATCLLLSTVLVSACSSNESGISVGPNFQTLSLYVSNSTQNAILIYPPNPPNASSPINQIGGSNTQLNGPQYLAFDSSKNLYVTNYNSGTSSGTVAEYKSQATGNVIPFAMIAGPGSSIGQPRGVAVDSSGTIYVANVGNPPTQTSSILVFAANSNGGVPPLNAITGVNTGLSFPAGLKVDSAGNIYVANSGNASVAVFAKGASGNVAPTTQIGGPLTGLVTPSGIALDAASNIWVADSGSNAIYEFAKGATGNVAPIATIAGANTGLSTPTDLLLDSTGKIYVTNRGTGTVLVFAAGASGNVAPAATLAASGTLVGIALSP